MNTKIRVVIVDDHDTVRAGIRSILERVPDIDVIGEARDGIEALELVENLEPQVLLLDIEMPKMNGRRVAEKINDKDKSVQILALSAHDDNQYILGMLKSGAAGYLTKDEVPELLVKAVRGVARGEEGWVSKRVADRISNWGRAGNGDRPTLTHLELRVLNLLAAKTNDQEIAQMMGISVEQVRQLIEELCQKFEAVSRVDLIVHARDAGLV